MKQFKLSAKFYVIFVVILIAPASYVASSIQALLTGLNADNILRQLADAGIIQTPTTVAVLLLLFLVVNKWMWQVPGLVKIFRLPHNINGRYEGELAGCYNKDEVYKIVLEIRQSLTEISVNLYTKNSASYSLVTSIGKNNQGNWALSYLYQNKTATVNHDEDMKDHNGVAILEIFNAGSKLKGNYFNNPRDRGRHGSIDVNQVGKKLLGHF